MEPQWLESNNRKSNFFKVEELDEFLEDTSFVRLVDVIKILKIIDFYPKIREMTVDFIINLV